MTLEFPDAPIDLHRLNALLAAELEDFRRGFEEERIPAEQDLRAGVVAWIATFAPEAISEATRDRLYLTCDAIRRLPDYTHRDWHRATYLDVAQYAVTGDPWWLEMMIANIDHRNRGLRTSLHAPFGLVAPTLDSHSADLMFRIENNLRMGHFHNESLMCLFSVLKGDAGVKREHARRWREAITLVPQDVGTLNKLIAGDLLSNTLIAGEYAEICRYLSCRLLDGTLAGSHRVNESVPRVAGWPRLTVNALWRRMGAHPLISSFVALEKTLI